MPAVAFGLIVALVLALIILVLVAVPARREGRDLLTARGEEVFIRVKTGTDTAAARTGDLVATAASGAAKLLPGDRNP